jgi:hypothetical protein
MKVGMAWRTALHGALQQLDRSQSSAARQHMAAAAPAAPAAAGAAAGLQAETRRLISSTTAAAGPRGGPGALTYEPRCGAGYEAPGAPSCSQPAHDAARGTWQAAASH